jgi:holo-[acyl-carrier protein] synthase
MISLFPKKLIQAGVDLVEIGRFAQFEQDRNHVFLQKTFSPTELTYCFSFSNPVVHLAGTFAAKEAVSKALGVKKFPYIEVEIVRDDAGKPEAFHVGKKLSITISITHTDTTACAIAVG